MAPEDRTPSEVVADAIVARYSDLAPSVSRIMQSGLDETGRLSCDHGLSRVAGRAGRPDAQPGERHRRRPSVSSEPV